MSFIFKSGPHYLLFIVSGCPYKASLPHQVQSFVNKGRALKYSNKNYLIINQLFKLNLKDIGQITLDVYIYTYTQKNTLECDQPNCIKTEHQVFSHQHTWHNEQYLKSGCKWIWIHWTKGIIVQLDLLLNKPSNYWIAQHKRHSTFWIFFILPWKVIGIWTKCWFNHEITQAWFLSQQVYVSRTCQEFD